MNWLDSGDVTETVEPQRLRRWIDSENRPSDEFDLHYQKELQRSVDDFKRLEGWQGDFEAWYNSLEISMFNTPHPFSYAHPETFCANGRQPKSKRKDKLPVITRHLYFENKSKSMGDIENEMRETERYKDTDSRNF